MCVFFFSSRRRHTRYWRDWSSDVCSSDLEEEFGSVTNNVYTTSGDTLITDILNVEKYDYILACGPTPMLKKLVDMTENTKTRIQVSLENHMACGVGACLVCTCKTKTGNKKTCKDGPVFWGEDVIL